MRQLQTASNRGSTSCLTTCHSASARRIVTVTVGWGSVPVTASTIVSTPHNTVIQHCLTLPAIRLPGEPYTAPPPRSPLPGSVTTAPHRPTLREPRSQLAGHPPHRPDDTPQPRVRPQRGAPTGVQPGHVCDGSD